MDKIRCKFNVDSITHRDDNGDPVVAVEMSAVTGDGSPENDAFWKYTPSGSLLFTTVNASAVASLKPGGEYYLDIIPAVE
ncbi:hypothetical protein LCGC14_0659290 [marine sediment metagenome]|uniref:Uncharacterized protein n=1 Tax=marine sediment metagenome TaxID=412755 RepID=A0A0F9U2G3_9ZZZZ